VRTRASPRSASTSLRSPRKTGAPQTSPPSSNYRTAPARMSLRLSPTSCRGPAWAARRTGRSEVVSFSAASDRCRPAVSPSKPVADVYRPSAARRLRNTPSTSAPKYSRSPWGAVVPSDHELLLAGDLDLQPVTAAARFRSDLARRALAITPSQGRSPSRPRVVCSPAFGNASEMREMRTGGQHLFKQFPCAWRAPHCTDRSRFR